ncbi:hypothetical protein ALQ84_200037 [Pseudomonas caricapapayae]|uniref:Uncharacterized protein n=1 Tax=Pseudomonas caricapapayae TaxID=46678 RepID=A0A3M6H0Y0_9PSED|nr:hypothetical protein ALQ84_200037 [Pseudomonas caricapapayae]RMV98474.1 hypothetical protein ALP01_200377 [Pseudomonas caricapapayae]
MAVIRWRSRDLSSVCIGLYDKTTENSIWLWTLILD